MYTISRGNCPSFSCTTSRGASFQDGVAAGKGFLQTITADMLHRVWDEFDYSVDMYRAHMEGMWLVYEKLGQLPLLTVCVVPV
jgi:hypothetical protein